MRLSPHRQVFLVILFLLILPAMAKSEIYGGIEPLSTLGDVKEILPNAKFERSYPAWATTSDAFYQVTGEGLQGKILINFHDYRPFFKERAMLGENQSSQETSDFLNGMANQSDEEALEVEWLRWIPAEPLPIQRLISRYGNPTKSGYTEDGFNPYKYWPDKGVLATVTDDCKYFTMIDYSFTNSELRKAWIDKRGFVPDYLNEVSSKPKPKPKAKPKAK